MKANLYDQTGKKTKEITLPELFEKRVRVDLISKVVESKKIIQPYGPSPIAGNQSSASGNIVHRRHVWKTHYGRGMSRVPRKRMSRRGTQFNWIAAVIPSARKGRRAHPPKVVGMANDLRINKKEMKLAIISALSATINENFLKQRYETLKETKIENYPAVISLTSSKLKVKEIVLAIKNILGKELSSLAFKKKSVRSGKGKTRGRKYKQTAGVLFVIGNEEKVKTKLIDVVNVKSLSVNDLAKGGPGRLTIYSENAIKELEEKLK